MDLPQLVQSKYDKVQLIDQGFLLCTNKSRGNKHHFRCTLNKPTQCKATAILKGSLEEGQFEVVHHVEKHQHESSPHVFLLMDFIAQYKLACREKLDTPVQRVYEELRVSYATSLPAAEKAKFLTSLPSLRGALMMGYRARGIDCANLPQTLDEVVIAERFTRSLDGEMLYRGKSDKNCHLWQSSTQSKMLGQGKRMWVDCTYSITSKPFKQTMITRTEDENGVYTTSFSLLPNKEKATYVSALQQIKQTCESDGQLLDIM